jgi:glycosyltransferase involved in cell wall biosynthesis/folate-dependent phosphoribosylglycinamide formyltransferase PurN
MAWRLFQAGMPPVAVVVEKRGRMASRGKEPLISLFFKLGIGFFWKRAMETFRIRSHFYLRKILGHRFKAPNYLSIEELALDFPVRLYEVEDHNGAETKELLWRLEPDVGILTNTRRIKKEILEMPRHGFLNLHLSALPKYAGLDSIFWALYHGEKEIGVTVHFASEKIDRGDIVLQKKIAVSGFDKEESLYEKALWLGTFLMIQALRQLQEGALTCTPQNSEKATYFSWPTPKERKMFRRSQPGSLREGRKANEAIQARNDGRTRVLHVITRMIRGGAQENTLATVRGLSEKGYKVTLATGPTWGNEGELISETLQEEMEVIVIPELTREIEPWKDLIAFGKLISLLSKERYDIVHTHTSKGGFLGRLAARLAKVPVTIHTPHGHVFHSYFSRPIEALFLFLERQSARLSSRLVALTEAEREEHLKLGVGRPDQWMTIPSGVNENRFSDIPANRKRELRSLLGIPSEKTIVGFIGRLASVKGAHHLLEAIPKIRESAPETHFLFVGDGEERLVLEKRVNELGLAEALTFTGYQEDISEFLALVDILVVPSLNEGMGRVIAEGGLAGKPVIASNVGGIPDLVKNNETGILVSPRSPSEIAQAVIRLVRDPELGRELGANLRRRVQEGFTERQMVEKIHSLYQQLLGLKEVLREESKSLDREAALSGDRASSGR